MPKHEVRVGDGEPKATTQGYAVERDPLPQPRTNAKVHKPKRKVEVSDLRNKQRRIKAT